MSEQRGLLTGRIYRHWKGNLYKVLGEIKIKNKFREGMALRLDPFGFVIATTSLPQGCDAVIYQDKDGSKYAREKNSFLEVLGDKVEGTMYYRFELVADEQI